MPELVVGVEIPAPPERVWAVLTDFTSYQEWNPYQTVTGKAEPLSWVRLSSRKLGTGDETAEVRAVIWTFEPAAKLEFLSGKPFIFSRSASFTWSRAPKARCCGTGSRFPASGQNGSLSAATRSSVFNPATMQSVRLSCVA